MTFSRDRFLLIYIGTQASIDDCLYVSLSLYIYMRLMRAKLAMVCVLMASGCSKPALPHHACFKKLD